MPTLPPDLVLGAAVVRSLLRAGIVSQGDARAWVDVRAAELPSVPEWLTAAREATEPRAMIRALGEVPMMGDVELEEMGPHLVRVLRDAIEETITPHLAFTITTQPYLLVHPQFQAAARKLGVLHALADQYLPEHARSLEPPTPEELAALGPQVRELLDGVLGQPDWNDEEDAARSPYDQDDEL